MGMSKLCVSFTLKGRNKKRSGPEKLEVPERSSMETALENSLILNEIISRLPHSDVLTARLVSKSWNSEAISVLRRQNALITIDGHNYQPYLFQLIKTSHKSLLTYHCDQSLKISMRIENYWNQQDFDKISLGLMTLVRLFESPTCIDSVYVGRGMDWKMHCSWQKLIKSLTFCQAGLRHITINCAIVLETPDEQQQQMQVAQSPVNSNPKAMADARILLESFSFPQLESLNMTLALGNNFSVLALTAIINAAPRVRKLVVNGNGSSTSKYNCQLVQILRGMRPLTLLDELELDIGNGSCFQALRPVLFPQLTALRLQCSNNNYPRLAPVVDQAQHLNYFLRFNCPKLTSLDFCFEPSNSGAATAVGAGQEFPMGLPTMPNLRSFGYHGGTLDSCCYINVHKSALVPGTMFPALRSISTNLGAVLSFGQCIWSDGGRRALPGPGAPAGEGAGAANVRLKFTQVDTLCLRIPHATDTTAAPVPATTPGGGGIGGQAASPSASMGRCSIEDNLQQLQQLYPNIKNLVMDNEIVRTTTTTEVESNFPEDDGGAMVDILHLVLARFPTLEALEIRNYYRDWLCLALAESGKVLPNLKQLTLSTADRQTYPTDLKPADLNLATVSALLHFLPNLVSLNVSSRLVSHPHPSASSGGSTNWLVNGEYVNWYPTLKITIT